MNKKEKKKKRQTFYPGEKEVKSELVSNCLIHNSRRRPLVFMLEGDGD